MEVNKKMMGVFYRPLDLRWVMDYGINFGMIHGMEIGASEKTSQ